MEGDYKLIMYPMIKVDRLYNIKQDPLEMNDLAGNPEYAARIAQLKKTFAGLQQEMHDPLDMENPKPLPKPAWKKKKNNKNKH